MGTLRVLCMLTTALLSLSACSGQNVYSLSDLVTNLNAGATKLNIM